jgi:peptidoglycan/xylan/chitin deacetylase (PgdA/CDA1 family)
MRILFLAAFASLVFASCSNSSSTETKSKDTVVAKEDGKATNQSTTAQNVDPNAKPANAATIMARKQVPILCYHHIREAGQPSKSSAGYEVTADLFKAQMKILADSGYHSILPDQLYNYLVYGASLPEKPFMITYDDTDEEQFSIAKKEMDKYGFKGVYFLMTISIGKPRYMSKEQIKQLADEGHAVECHTWDHHRTDRYTGNDWEIQLDKPKKTIEDITGKPVKYFAYPFGVWSPTGFPELKKRDYKLAFQLSTKRDSTDPLYTVRRFIVSPGFTPEKLLSGMRTIFK